LIIKKIWVHSGITIHLLTHPNNYEHYLHECLPLANHYFVAKFRFCSGPLFKPGMLTLFSPEHYGNRQMQFYTEGDHHDSCSRNALFRFQGYT